MDPKSKTRIATMLRFTYRTNMVFFAGFAAWYLLKALPCGTVLSEMVDHIASPIATGLAAWAAAN
jgi:hypothetical protein